jgi:hypothetical protein
MTALSNSASAALRRFSRLWDMTMQSSETRPSRKELAGLVAFVARGSVTCLPAADAGQPAQTELLRDDGTRRKAGSGLFRVALACGLIAAGRSGAPSHGVAPVYVVTSEGRAALKRLLADPETAFQDQHRTLVQRSDPEHGMIMVNDAESPLAALARLKGRGGGLFLESAQVEAGERLRADFTRGQMQPSLGQRWEPVQLGRQQGPSAGLADLTDAALSARLRVEAALLEVGPELSGVLLDICCFLKGLTEVERERQWPARSAKLMLRTALAALARHYAAPNRTLRRPPAPPPHAP